MRYDGTDFVDADDPPPAPTPSPGGPSGFQGHGHAPTREELDSKLTTTQQELEKIRERREQLERARAALEESRRRRAEFHAGRDEMKQHLIRGIGVLEKTEFELRRDAQQMIKSLQGLKEALETVNGLNETQWTEENWDQELSRSLTVLENARHEWNSARLSWPLLDGKSPAGHGGSSSQSENLSGLATLPLRQLCKIGLALTWPVAAVALIAAITFLIVLLTRK